MRPLLVLLAFAPIAFAADLTFEKTKETLEFRDGKQLIARYHFGESVAKPYLWPVNAPGELAVTRAWPMVKGTPGETTDHVHQKSAWFCHGDVIPVGLVLKTKSADKHVRGVDFWSETAGHGKIVCFEVGKAEIDPKTSIRVPMVNEWKTPDGITILKENRTLTVHKLKVGYRIDWTISLKATDYDIEFGDTKEGSMGVRVPDAFRVSHMSGGSIASSDGKTISAGTKGDLKIWGQPADWHDYSGKVGDATAGIAIFDHPKNSFRASWHTRDYGLMAANPFGREKSGFPSQKGKTELAKLKKGETLELKYAIYAHTGESESGKVAEAYKAFVDGK